MFEPRPLGLGRGHRSDRHGVIERHPTCRGKGSPTVVLIAGGFEAGWMWTYALAPDDTILDEPDDAFSAGRGNPGSWIPLCSRLSPSSRGSVSTIARTPPGERTSSRNAPASC